MILDMFLPLKKAFGDEGEMRNNAEDLNVLSGAKFHSKLRQ